VDAQTFPSTRDWQRLQQRQPQHGTISSTSNSEMWPGQHALWQFNAYCTILLYGTMVQESVQRFTALSAALVAARSTAVRRRHGHLEPDHVHDDTAIPYLLSQLSGGSVVMGITPVTVPKANHGSIHQSDTVFGPCVVTVVRVAATSNEDVYRLLHFGLQSLPLTTPCYQNRLSATQSARPPPPPPPPPVALMRQDTTTLTKQHAPRGSASARPTLAAAIAPVPAPLEPPHVARSSSDTLVANCSESHVPLIHHTTTRRQGPFSSSSWAAFLLADSALPTGSFAHSLGLEVTHQLGLLVRRASRDDSWNDVDVAVFVQTAVQSTLQLAVPFIVVSSRQTRQLVSTLDQGVDWNRVGPLAAPSPADQSTLANAALDSFCSSWLELDAHAHAMLVSNGPACRASLDQGTNLLRWAIHVLNRTSQYLSGGDHAEVNAASTNTLASLRAPLILSSIQAALDTSGGHGGHVATVFGLVSCLLDLSDDDAAELFGYCVTRDAVSSAVRLNVLGPLAGQALLYHSSMQSVTRCAIDAALAAMAAELRNNTQYSATSAAVAVGAATGCAPILDVIHPCHDILATRLFRS
jgi:urease accessory protein UreF